jgi:hypothetical protein
MQYRFPSTSICATHDVTATMFRFANGSVLYLSLCSRTLVAKSLDMAP